MSADPASPCQNARRAFPWLQAGVWLGLLLTAGVACVVLVFKQPDHRPTARTNLASEARDYLVGKNVKPLSGSLQELLAKPSRFHVKSQDHALLGKTAPPFELSDSYGKPWSLTDRLSKGPVVLVFYYGYHCNHCVGQLFSLHDDIKRFRELGIEVAAVSADSAELTQKRLREYGDFAFPVLSDPENRIAEKYGVFRPGRDGSPNILDHGTFVIGRDGIVRWAQMGDEPFTENRTLLHEAARIEGRLLDNSEDKQDTLKE